MSSDWPQPPRPASAFEPDLGARPYDGPLFKPVRQKKAKSRGLKAHKPLRASNPKRRAEKHARNFSGTTMGLPGHDDFVRSLPCCVSGQHASDVEPAHVVARGMGGAKGDWRELVPLRRKFHRELDRKDGLDAFERKHGVSLRGLRHALVVADPGVSPAEQLAAWKRLEVEHPDALVRGKVLQAAWDLCGYKVEPPKTQADVVSLATGKEPR